MSIPYIQFIDKMLFTNTISLQPNNQNISTLQVGLQLQSDQNNHEFGEMVMLNSSPKKY